MKRSPKAEVSLLDERPNSPPREPTRRPTREAPPLSSRLRKIPIVFCVGYSNIPPSFCKRLTSLVKIHFINSKVVIHFVQVCKESSKISCFCFAKDAFVVKFSTANFGKEPVLIAIRVQ